MVVTLGMVLRMVFAVGLLGLDNAAKGLKEALEKNGAHTEGLFCDEKRPTISKTRIIAGGRATVSQQIVRIDKESDKPGLIARCLRETGVPKERAVMIGDTRFDAEGAAAAGVSYIGVLYGYGTKEEMVSCGASVFAKSAEDLFSLLYAKDGIK